MTRNSIDLVIFLGLVLFTIAISFYVVNQPTIEIQLHDTYFVIDRLTFSVLILGPLTVLTFFPIATMRKFKSIGTNIALIFGLVLVAVICYSIVELQSSQLSQIDRSDEAGQRAYTSGRQLFQVTRGLLAVIGLAAIVLIYRTVRLWKQAYAGQQL